jgi:hypothetical protein
MPFVPFASVDRSTLRWLRTATSPLEFDLLSGETRIAHLAWSQVGGSLASAVTSEGTWTLKRGGFLNPHVTIRQSGSGDALARLTVHLSYHRIEMANGRAYRFHRAGVLVPAWKVTTDAGNEVLHIEPVREERALAGGAVIAAPSAVDLPELALLVVLSWYFIVLAWFEDEALVPLEGPDFRSEAAPGKAAGPSGGPTSS